MLLKESLYVVVELLYESLMMCLVLFTVWCMSPLMSLKLPPLMLKLLAPWKKGILKEGGRSEREREATQGRKAVVSILWSSGLVPYKLNREVLMGKTPSMHTALLT